MCAFTFCMCFHPCTPGLSVGVWLGGRVHALVRVPVRAVELTGVRAWVHLTVWIVCMRRRDVSNTGITALPDSIGNCRRLQVL
jgi:hypothetical protein